MAFSSNPYYYEVDIDHTKIDASLTDFIFYIGSMPAAFFSRAHSTGKDIRVSNAAGTVEFPIHLRHIDTGANTIRLFTRVSSVSVSVDTRIRVWCGDHTLSLYAATDTYGRNAVYNTKLAAAFSMSESASGTGTPDVYVDMTGAGNDGDDYVSAAGKDGQVGSGQEFDGSNDYVQIPSSDFYNSSNHSQGTVLCWAKADNDSTNQTIFCHSAATGTFNTFALQFAITNNSVFQPRMFQRTTATLRDVKATSVSLSPSAWYHVAFSVDVSGARVQVNGTPETLTAYAGTTSNTSWMSDAGTNPTHTKIGVFRYNGSDVNPFDGAIDELWISKGTALSAAYIKALYLNQLDPSSFYSVGSEKSNVSFLPQVIFI